MNGLLLSRQIILWHAGQIILYSSRPIYMDWCDFDGPIWSQKKQALNNWPALYLLKHVGSIIIASWGSEIRRRPSSATS